MVSEEVLNAIESLLVLEKLNCEPLELKEALGLLGPGKAPRKDIIPSEILKCYKGEAFTELYSPLSFCKDFWDGYWGRAIQPLVNLFALSPLTVPEVFAKVNSPQFRRYEYNFNFMFYVIYQAWDAVFDHQMKHWEESWKYDAQRLDELQGVASGDETLCRMLDITSQTKWLYQEKLRMQKWAVLHLISKHSLNINFRRNFYEFLISSTKTISCLMQGRETGVGFVWSLKLTKSGASRKQTCARKKEKSW